MSGRILVPLDGSNYSEAVLPFACTLANANRNEIVLLQAVEYPLEMYPRCYEYPPLDPKLAETILEKKEVARRVTENYLKSTASKIQMAGVKVITEVCEGPVVEAILDSIDRLHIHLIAMSTHGQGGDAHWMIGAVADRVLHEAKVPVILIRLTPNNLIANFFTKRSVPQVVLE
jgi:nucleotide-binding universal stress UspA family protein